MTFQLEIGDRLRTVEVEPASADGFKVIVDGHPRFVEAVSVGANAWSLIVRDEAGSEARCVEAIVLPHATSPEPGRRAGAEPGRPSAGLGTPVSLSNGRRSNGTIDVHIDGYRIPVHLRNGRARRARAVGGVHVGGVQRMTAPMPGKVVRVLVKTGDPVKTGQGLVVVEAMKMENELRASRDGRVGDVFVTEGQSVDAGTALVVVE